MGSISTIIGIFEALQASRAAAELAELIQV